MSNRTNENFAAWAAVNKDGQECIIYCWENPIRISTGWWAPGDEDSILEYDILYVEDGYIEGRIGKKLTWDDEPHLLYGH